MSALPDAEPDDAAAHRRRDAERLVACLLRGSADFGALFGRYGRPAPALRHFGLIKWGAGDLQEAAALFGAGLAFDAGNADLWRDFAGVREALADNQGAEEALRASLALDSGSARTWLMLANLCSRTGRNEDAASAFRRALDIDPAFGDALFGQGLLQFQQGNLEAAADSLRQALRNGFDLVTGSTALGHVLYLTDDFAGCAGAFAAAMDVAPLDQGARRKYARAATIQRMIEKGPVTALALYPELAGEAAEDLETVSREAFHQLSAYGHAETAIDLGERRLALDPDDATQRYLLDALRGRPLTKAPVEYVESCFDAFAETFDQKLVTVLRYDVPGRLARLVARGRSGFTDILDLGCGTGLAADHLAGLGGRLSGIDVAARMLDAAARRGRYAELHKQEAVGYLSGQRARFDLVFAADMLVYLGDLRPLFEAVARALRSDGIFAFSIESVPEGEYALLPSGRFAHAERYVEALAARDFTVLAQEPSTIRLDAGRPADGVLLVLARRG